MAVYRVTSPSGEVFRVTAPEGASEAQIVAYAQANYAKSNAPKPALPSYGATDLAANKFTLGLADKLGAVATAAGQTIRSGGNFGENYQTAQTGLDAARTQYQEANPVIDWGTLPLNLAGGGPSLASTAKAIVMGGKGAIGEAAKLGTMFGALGGAGGSRGTLPQQAAQTAASTGVGAALAPVAAPVVNMASKVAARVTGRAGTQASRDLTKAGVILTQKLRDQGMTPAQAAMVVQEAHANGVPLALMDTGDEMRGLAAAISRKPGDARALIRQAVITRQLNQGERVQGAITRNIGPTVGTATEAQRLEQSAKASAAPLYEQAYAAGVVDDPVINALVQHPEMQSAIASGKQIHADETFMANAKGEPPPAPLPEDGVDVRTLDYAKRALDRKIDAAYSGDSAGKLQLPMLKELRSTMLGALDKAVPEFAAARAAYGGPMQAAEALTMGKAAINKSADDIAAEIADLSASQLAQYRLGHRSAMADLVDSKGFTADNVNALIGSAKKQKVLAELYGGEANLTRLLKTLEQERQGGLTYKAVDTGSPTAPRLAEDADLASIGAETAIRALGGQSMWGNFMSAIGQLYSYGGSKAAARIQNQLATAISEKSPVAIRAAVNAANKSAKQAAIASHVSRRTASVATAPVGTIAVDRSAQNR